MEEADVPLTLGAAYFAHEHDFNRYQKARKRAPKEVGVLPRAPWEYDAELCVDHDVQRVRGHGLFALRWARDWPFGHDVRETYVRDEERHGGHGPR